MNSILIIGSFLSKERGSKGSGETLAEYLSQEGFIVKLSSYISNRFLRLIDIIFSTLFCKYDCIIIEGYSGLSFIFLEASCYLAYVRRKKILISIHGGKIIEFSIHNKNRIKAIGIVANFVRTPSLFIKQGLSVFITKIEYLPNFINLNTFTYNHLLPLEPNFKILWVRAFTDIYNPFLPIKMLLKIKEKYPYSTLTMIGPDLGLRKKVEAAIKELALENSVHILGAVKNVDLPKYFHNHHVFLNTTSYESFGVAVLEAAASGIPIVSSKVGEIPYLWTHEENILLVEELKPDLFADAVIRILESPELAQKLSVKARKKAVEFDWEHIKPQWIQLLQQFDEK